MYDRFLRVDSKSNVTGLLDQDNWAPFSNCTVVRCGSPCVHRYGVRLLRVNMPAPLCLSQDDRLIYWLTWSDRGVEREIWGSNRSDHVIRGEVGRWTQLSTVNGMNMLQSASSGVWHDDRSQAKTICAMLRLWLPPYEWEGRSNWMREQLSLAKADESRQVNSELKDILHTKRSENWRSFSWLEPGRLLVLTIFD